VAFDPAGPGGFHLLRGQRVELGRKLARQLGQNRPSLVKTDESGGSGGGRRASSDEQQDADNPNVRVRNASILSGFDPIESIGSEVSQGDVGIDRRGAACRQEARTETGEDQRYRNDGQHPRIEDRDVELHVLAHDAALCARTFCNFAREFSSFRQGGYGRATLI